jgi:guanosine-3',5'-bis(diphosphate) 3'-pyrophosphohydrolase
MRPLADLARAFDFAARRHVHQRRKGEAAEPYVNHLAEVAALLAEATGGDDPVLLIASLLHDTIEDQDVTRDEIAAAFGAAVADLVVEVTDDTSLPKVERKRRQVEHAPRKTTRAKLLKLADKTSNLRAIAHSPPSWPVQRQRDYIDWAESVIAGLRGTNARLERAFDEAAHAARAAVEKRARSAPG